MQYIKYPEKEIWRQLIKRPVADILSLEIKVKKIIEKVKATGDKALHKYAKEFDKIKIKKLNVTTDEITAASALISDDLKDSIQLAKQNIEKFHYSQQEEIKIIETMPGIQCWRKSAAIEKVGLYIPGGSAPLFSTVLMLGVPAQIAGCKEIVLCTPSLKDGTVHPAILYAASLCGISTIFKTGGAQAVAAMAYGTESIPKVYKIFGPGNQYVTCAKQLLQQVVAIDIPAGPSEVLIIADETAVPEFVAADLLSQAEHGPDSQVMLLTTSESVAETIIIETGKQLEKIPRKAIAEQALQNSRVVVLKDINEAIELSNVYAPEHLIIACDDAMRLAEKITAAGSVFVGNYSPESAGDYASGTNHTLPTNGYAAMYSGVSLESFMKKITFQQLTKEGLKNIAAAVTTMAAAENLEAHKKAIEIRLK